MADEITNNDLIRNDPDYLGMHEKHDGTKYVLLKGNRTRPLNELEQEYAQQLKDKGEEARLAQQQQNNKKPENNNPNFGNNDVGSQCATCKTGACSCIYSIKVLPENQPEILWKQNNLMKEVVLIDKGKGSKVTFNLKPKGKNCSNKLSDCPQFFISNVMIQENIWEEYKEFGINKDEEYTLKYQLSYYKKIKGDSVLIGGYAGFIDVAKAIFTGVLPEYLYPQRYQLTAIECKNTGKMPEKGVTSKLTKQRTHYSKSPIN